MMFQNDALFPHLSVEGNVAFGLKRAGLPRPDIAARVAEMLALVRMSEFGGRKPDQLSGGQRQRVALARALALRPRVLLLDEPLAALDKALRESTQSELMEIQRRLGTTFIIVTHDQEEAMMVADRIGVMNRGQLVQVATPRDLYERPASRWVAGFIGDVNMIEARVTGHGGGTLTLAASGIGEVTARHGSPLAAGASVVLALRPERIRLQPAAADTPEARAGVVEEANYLGSATAYKIRLASGAIIKARAANAAADDSPFAPGERVAALFAPDAAIVLEG
jgi:putrescine transport system ATP-binding protein